MSITTSSGNQPGQNPDKVQKVSGKHAKIADLLAMPGVEDIEFDIPQLRDLAKPAKAVIDLCPVPNSSTVSK